ncbi:MAG: DUF2779 domain-containing protein [Bacilli bacterium]|nr:DUF2779 domain-containing protein [Bacilli bacterium]
MYLSKSKYCNGVQCNKMLWLDKFCPLEKEDISNTSVLDNGSEVGELAKGLFGDYIDIEFNTNLTNMISDTLEVIKNNNKVVITEASFSYDNNFCSVDILKKIGNKYEMYEVKSSTEVKDIYLDDISYQYYVLTSLGYDVVKASIVYINNKYIRNKELDLNKLFNIEDVTSVVVSKQEEVKTKIKEINDYMLQKDEPLDDIGIHCVKPYDCPFFNYCTRNLPINNVFNIMRMRNSTKFNLYHKGVYTYEDLLKEDIDVKFKEQIEFELFDKEDKINKKEIKEFMSTLTYPLYFLDFETYQQSIPLYDGIRPYEQIPFQYSLHYIESENDNLRHKEFLSEPDIDPRRGVAEKLVSDIPKDVCVLAYNMSFEKTVIKNLAELFPDLKDHLLNIRDNIKDLMIPFYNRSYYSKDMHGSYSIKYVLPALFKDDPSLDYHNLDDVHNGSEAMNAFSNMGKLNIEERRKLRYNLLKYCELDTFAMVKIWEKLKEIK